MENKLFDIEKGIVPKVLEIISLILVVGGAVALVLSKEIFAIIVYSAFAIFFIAQLIDKKSEMTGAGAKKPFIGMPILFNNNEMYLLSNKGFATVGMVLLVVVFGAAILLRVKMDAIECLIVWVILLDLEFSELNRKANMAYLKKNGVNVDNIIKKKNMLWSYIKVNKITKVSDEVYMIEFNNMSREVVFTKRYNNYEELINLVNQKATNNISSGVEI